MASMTIKQLADSIGVSKTAVRKKMDDAFRDAYITKGDDGSLLVSETGCEEMQKRFAKTTENHRELSENTENQFAETGAETTGNQGFQLVIETLREQLAAKDAQIAALNERLAEASATITETARALSQAQLSLQAEQKLHYETMQLKAPEETVTVEPKPVPEEKPKAEATRKPPEQKRKQEQVTTKKKEGLISRLLGRNRRV